MQGEVINLKPSILFFKRMRDDSYSLCEAVCSIKLTNSTSKKKEQGEETFSVASFVFQKSVCYTVSFMKKYKKSIAAYTLKLHELVEVILLMFVVQDSDLMLFFHFFFSSCLLKKCFSASIERGWQLFWCNTITYSKSLYCGVVA